MQLSERQNRGGEILSRKIMAITILVIVSDCMALVNVNYAFAAPKQEQVNSDVVFIPITPSPSPILRYGFPPPKCEPVL